MSAWLWLLVPFAPLLGAALLPWLRERALPWLWLSGLPALLAALVHALALSLALTWLLLKECFTTSYLRARVEG